MKIPFGLVFGALMSLAAVGYASPAAAQDGPYVNLTPPSGISFKVFFLSLPTFFYPRHALHLWVEVFVVLAFDVNEQGELIDLRVTESKPRLVFDKAATQYIKKFKFQPPSLDGSVVYASDISMRMPFRLE